MPILVQGRARAWEANEQITTTTRFRDISISLRRRNRFLDFTESVVIGSRDRRALGMGPSSIASLANSN